MQVGPEKLRCAVEHSTMAKLKQVERAIVFSRVALGQCGEQSGPEELLRLSKQHARSGEPDLSAPQSPLSRLCGASVRHLRAHLLQSFEQMGLFDLAKALGYVSYTGLAAAASLAASGASQVGEPPEEPMASEGRRREELRSHWPASLAEPLPKGSPKVLRVTEAASEDGWRLPLSPGKRTHLGSPAGRLAIGLEEAFHLISRQLPATLAVLSLG